MTQSKLFSGPITGGLLRGLLMTTLILPALACTEKATNSADAAAAAAAAKADAPQKDYIATGSLSLVHANQEITSNSTNTLKLSGKGSKSTYKFAFHFNSGAADFFKLMKMTRNVQSTGCSVNEENVLLKSAQGSQEINVVSKAALRPNTDYVVEISTPHSGCSELALTYSVVAWADASGTDVEPNFATLCKGSKVSIGAFFPQRDMMTVFVPGSTKEFIGTRAYCGERVDEATKATIDCKSHSLGTDVDAVNCDAKYDTHERTHQIVSDHQFRTVSVSCTADGVTTFTDEFKSCREMILDLNQYAAKTP